MQDQAEKTIKYYEDVISCMPGNVYMLDTNCMTVGCNNNVLTMFGLSNQNEFKGLDFEAMAKLGNWAPEATEKFKQDSIRVIETGMPIFNTEEPPIPDSHGEMIHFLTSRVPLRGADGNIVGLVGISVDITERKKIEANLRHARKQAEIANLAKSEFVATTSHELRTPLNVMMGMAQLLLKKTDDLEMQQMLTAILQSGSHLLGLITDILDFSKLEADKFELIKTTFSLKKCFESNIKHLRQLLERRSDIQFNCHVADDVPEYIVADAKCLRQLLFNLIGNAVKFTHRGEITVKVKCLSRQDRQAVIQIDIHDTGIGIPKDKLDIIFDRFTQVDSTYDRRYGGTGLGLTVCKKIVGKLKGELGVESEEHKGSHFWFTMPCEVADVKEMAHATKDVDACAMNYQLLGDSKTYPSLLQTATLLEEMISKTADTTTKTTNDTPQSANDLKNKLIVLVEDEKINQVIIISMLKKLDSQPKTFSTALQALAYLKENSQSVDLILTDIGLPDMNGIEFIKAVRKERRSHIPIFAITGYCSDDDYKNIITAGADEVFNKPVELDLLDQMMQKYLREKPKHHDFPLKI